MFDNKKSILFLKDIVNLSFFLFDGFSVEISDFLLVAKSLRQILPTAYTCDEKKEEGGKYQSNADKRKKQ